MPLCVAAQDSDETEGNSGKNTAWEPSERYDIVEFSWSKMLKYEEADLPESKIDYNGHEVTVRANVAVSADTCINDNRLIKLSIFLKPDNTDGFSPVRKDSINERATYNTVVLHNRLFGKEGKYTLKGEADVYARSFSPTQCTAADKARLTYTARVDVANPSASTIKYKLVEAEWEKADPVIPTPSNQGYRYSGHILFLMHDAGTRPLGTYITNDDGVVHTTRKGDMFCTFRFSERYAKNKEESKYYTGDTELRELQANFILKGLFQTDPPTGINNGNTEMGLVVSPYYIKKGPDGGIYSIMASKRDGKITGQYENLLLARWLPYSRNDEYMKLDARMHAKCRLIKNKSKEPFAMPHFFCEQATFSCLIHD